MPIPLLPLIGAFILGNTKKKTAKKQAVSKHTKEERNQG